MRGSKFFANTARRRGALYFVGVGSATVADSLVVDNTAVEDGGGVYVSTSARVAFINDTLYRNEAPRGGGLFLRETSDVLLTQCIVADSTNGEGLYGTSSSSRALITHSAIAGNYQGAVKNLPDPIGCLGTVAVAPTFVAFSDDGDFANDDFHLASSSALIDAGDPAILDLDGTRSDIGAYGGSGGPELDKDGDGITASGGDCNDTDPSIYPNAVELKDSKDNDCNGTIDDPYTDKDNDGYDPAAGDCNDGNPSVHPGVKAVCDGKDQNCNGKIDEGKLSTFYFDNDGDGVSLATKTVTGRSAPAGYTETPGDGDDGDATRRPVHGEACDLKDNDCNGLTDEGVETTYYPDGDGDGFGATAGAVLGCTLPLGFVKVAGDCDDTNPLKSPASPEACNGQDDNCNVAIDEGVMLTYYSETHGDCDDAKPAVHPTATELSDGVDNDCDGQTDETQSATKGDTDDDGLSDEFEVEHGLDPEDPGDGASVAPTLPLAFAPAQASCAEGESFGLALLGGVGPYASLSVESAAGVVLELSVAQEDAQGPMQPAQATCLREGTADLVGVDPKGTVVRLGVTVSGSTMSLVPKSLALVVGDAA